MSANGGVSPFGFFPPSSSDPDRNDRSRFLRSLALSAAFWVLACVLFALLPLVQRSEPKRIFQAVTITLAPSPRVGKAVQAGNEAQAPAARESDARPSATAKGPKTSKSPKTANATRSAGASASSGLGIPDFAPESRPLRRTDASGDILEFGSTGNEAGTTQARKASETATSAVPELEGSAAAVQNPQAKPVRASSGGRNTSGAQGTASAETSRALGDIAGAAGKGPVARTDSSGAPSASDASGGAGQTGSARAGTATTTSSGSQGAGAVSTVSSLAFEGTPRRLLYPASPAITLPESLARTVDSNRSVTVSFTVLADGSVPSALVRFTPQAALSPEIRDYLTKEFSRWRFEKSAQDGQAQFLYSIRIQ